ncbi:MAG: hypothetical protein RJB66_424 [Pseudomonadota bacterium]|jgi:hypothetical protein
MDTVLFSIKGTSVLYIWLKNCWYYVRHYFLLYFLVSLLGPLAMALELTGQVLEKGTRQPLKMVNVYLLPLKLKAVTDEKGRFEFREFNLEGLAGEIVISVSGYKRFTKNLSWSAEISQLDSTFFVERESYRYQETTVRGLREKKAAQKNLSQEEFLQMPGSNGDPIKAVQNLPGINRSTGGSARVVIQGSEPEDTRYHLEGHEVPLIFHFGGVTSLITPEAVESVDYFSAGHGAEWSRAIGGHIGLNTRRPKTDRHHGMAFVDALNSGFLAEGPIDEASSYLISGRISYIGEVLEAIAKDNENFDLVVAPSFYDIHTQYQKQLNERDELRIQTIASNDRLSFVLAEPMGNDPKLRGSFNQETKFYRIMPSWERKIDADHSAKVSMAYGANDITFDLGTNYFRLRNNALTTLGEYKSVINSSWKTTLGFDNLYDWFDVSVRLPVTFSEGGIANPVSSGEFKESRVKGRQASIGAFWTNEWKPFINQNPDSPWSVLPQVRLDKLGPTKELLAQPRVSLRYQSSAFEQWRLNTGLYHQVPQPQDLSEDFGNPDLKSQRAKHYAIAWERDLREGATNGWRLSSSLFYKDLDRLVVSSTSKVTRDGVEVFENFNNNGLGRIHGLETQVRYQKEDWSWIVNYTLLESRRWSPGKPVLPSAFDQTHSLNLLMGYQFNEWRYGARFRYVTGNPYTPVIGSQFDADNDVYIPSRGAVFSQRNGDFKQFDLRIDRQWIYDTWILSAYVDIQNLTNEKNPESLTYSYNYAEKQEISGIPVLPTLGVKGEF